MADTINTIGTASDYADPILWAAGQGAVNDGNRQVGILQNSIAMTSLFRLDQAWPNGALLKGKDTVTGRSGDGQTLTSTDTQRICFSPVTGVEFEDIEFGNTVGRALQDVESINITRCLMPVGELAIDPDNDVIATNTVLDSTLIKDSVTSGSLTTINCTLIDRCISRENNLFTALNCNSLPNDWYFGRGSEAGAETLVNFTYIKQNAPAGDFGTGSSDNTLNTDTTLEMVDFAGGDYRVKSTSTLSTSGQGGTFVGAFLEVSSGISIAVDSTLPSLSSSLSLSKIDNSFSIDINSTLPSLISSLSLTNTDNLFDLSVSSELPSLTSILNLSVVNPGNNTSINSFLPSLVSSLNLTKTDPAAGVSINSELPNLISSLSLTVANPEFDFSVVSTLPSLSSSLSLYNGVLGISVGDRNNINIVVKSTNINVITKSRNIEEY